MYIRFRTVLRQQPKKPLCTFTCHENVLIPKHSPQSHFHDKKSKISKVLFINQRQFPVAMINNNRLDFI